MHTPYTQQCVLGVGLFLKPNASFSVEITVHVVYNIVEFIRKWKRKVHMVYLCWHLVSLKNEEFKGGENLHCEHAIFLTLQTCLFRFTTSKPCCCLNGFGLLVCLLLCHSCLVFWRNDPSEMITSYQCFLKFTFSAFVRLFSEQAGVMKQLGHSSLQGPITVSLSK